MLLASDGSDTLVRSHPRLATQSNRSTVIHWILPGASALVLGAALNLIPNGLLWWLGLPLIFTVLLLAVFNDTLPHWSGPGFTRLFCAPPTDALRPIL